MKNDPYCKLLCLVTIIVKKVVGMPMPCCFAQAFESGFLVHEGIIEDVIRLSITP